MESPPYFREVIVSYTRSSGPGGQHVNKTNTAVQLRWPLISTMAFSESQKFLLLKKLSNRLTVNGELLVECSEYRERYQNVREAFDKLNHIVRAALHVAKPRKATRPSKGAQERRKIAKKIHKEKKMRRQKKFSAQ